MSEEIGVEADEGKAKSVVFTERLKSGYSTTRNKELRDGWNKRKNRKNIWIDLGPNNVGGRVTCLAAKPGRDGNRLLAGAACGGLWNGTVTGKQSNLRCEWKTNLGNPVNGDDQYLLMHNIGALAIEGTTIYCGTGHAYHAGDSFPGVGLFRSDNGGDTWKCVKESGKDFPQRISTIAVNGTQVWIGGVVLPDEQENESEEVECSGIFYSNNRGETWKRQDFKLNDEFAQKSALSTGPEGIFKEGIFKDRDYQCHSIVFIKNLSSDAPDEVILAALTAPMGWGGIWRSKDKGVTWEQLRRGLPGPREFGRTSLAVASTNPKIVYAFIGAADGRCLGVFRSGDGGDHWVSRGVEHFAGCGSLNYVNALTVSPEDPDIVVCGARDLHRSIDGGQTWTQVTEWFAAPDSSGYSHADHHALLWPAKDRLYSANDGGVDMSDDQGITWRNLNSGLAIAMFYDIDVAPTFRSSNQNTDVVPDLIIAGGTQDNASVITDFRASGIGFVPTCSGLQLGLTQDIANEVRDRLQSAGSAATTDVILNFDASGITNFSSEPAVQLFVPEASEPQQSGASAHAVYGNVEPKPKAARNFVDILFGDGGWTVFDPNDPLHVYGSSQNMTIYRHRRDNGWQIVTPADASDDERNSVWMAILAMHRHDPNVVFTGSTRVWRTKNDGVDWIPVSDHLDGSPITAIEIADNDPNFIYVGTENGNIFKSVDGGNRWNDEPGEDRPKPMEWRKDLHERPTIGVARTITRIEAHPQNARRIAVTLMGFDRNYRLPHVLWFDGEVTETKSENKKTRWIDLSDTLLPNVHHNVITWDEKGDYLFVGNDVGVWALNITEGKFEKKHEKYNWCDISAKLPNAIVTDLVYHHATDSLTAATYGRSLWWADGKAWRGEIQRPAHLEV